MERARERYWQERWAVAGLSRAKRDPAKTKFYALVAYPGASGFLHLGHLRGLVIADALHRYHRMKGHAVFFPTGTHASGLPSVTFAQRVQEGDAATLAQIHEQGVAPGDVAPLADPSTAARFLGETYRDVYRRMGILVDESAYVTTIDEDYQRFIAWQFRRLHDRGGLIQAPYSATVCPVDGPVSVDPSETDLASGGDAEIVRFRTVPFRLADGRVLLAATLRPETVFGVTNLWISPTAPLVVWHHEGSEFLATRPGAVRLREQHGGHLGPTVAPDDVLRRTVPVPLAETDVPILSSGLVDPALGTGIVMSVPAHAPADWLACAELTRDDERALPPVAPILELTGQSDWTPSERDLLSGAGPPAERAARATGARTLADRAALAEATERLYRLELLRGRMVVGPFAGRPVAEAREAIAAALGTLPGGLELEEFSKPVRCRNGHEVIIRRIPDQWFVHYGESAWKRRTSARLPHLTVRPEEYARELPAILEWLGDRPATRKGRWLGTPFPLDPAWVIEPIADSTLYPAYFVVRRYVATGRIPTAALTDAFFDFVFLGAGPGESSIARELQEEVREEFLYWYPLDLNIGGKEHQRVHFPPFLATHALLLPPELAPRGIFVHWWVTGPSGGKISKKEVSSKGGAIPPIRGSLERWGADAIRLFHASAASPFQDVAWDAELVDRLAERLAEIERLFREPVEAGTGPVEVDLWLESEAHDLVRAVGGAFDRWAPREAAEAVYVTLPRLLRRHRLRGGGDGASRSKVLDVWARLLSPVTPHLAEELGNGAGRGLVAERKFPEATELEFSPVARERERYLDRIEEDLREVLKPALARGEAPSAVAFFVAAPWKRTIESWLRGLEPPRSNQVPTREVMERAREHPELAAFRPTIPAYIQRVWPLLRSEPRGEPPELDEVLVLREAAGYLLRRFGFSDLQVFPELEAEPHDPHRRRERARPGRPAFYLTGGSLVPRGATA